MPPNTYIPPVQPSRRNLKPVLISIGVIFGIAVVVFLGILLFRDVLKPMAMAVSPAPSVGYITTGQIALKWDKIESATSYTVECATDKEFNQVVSSSTAASTNYICSGLKPATAYFVRLKVTLPNGMTSWSSTVTVKTISTPVFVTNLKASVVSKSEIKLSWDPINDVETYDVQWATDKSFTTNVTNITSKNSVANAQSLKAGTTYYFRVRATSSANSMSIIPYSDYISARTN